MPLIEDETKSQCEPTPGKQSRKSHRTYGRAAYP